MFQTENRTDTLSLCNLLWLDMDLVHFEEGTTSYEHSRDIHFNLRDLNFNIELYTSLRPIKSYSRLVWVFWSSKMILHWYKDIVLGLAGYLPNNRIYLSTPTSRKGGFDRHLLDHVGLPHVLDLTIDWVIFGSVRSSRSHNVHLSVRLSIRS